MNLVKWLVRPVYAVEKRSSEEQLRVDFGDFPPVPLRCESFSGEFDVVRVRGVGEVLSQLIILNTMLRGIASEEDRLSVDLIDVLGAEQIQSLQRGLEYLGRYGGLLKSAAIALMLGVMGVRLSGRMIRGTHRDSSMLARFVPIRKDESNIFVNVARLKRVGANEAPTISHEHIHLLQYRDLERHSRDAKSPETLLSPGGSAKPYLRYLLQKMEVEARLHETVLAYYRYSHRLPLTVPKFLGVLAGNPEFGELVSLTLQNSGASFDREIEPYVERAGACTGDLHAILVYIATEELTCKFITEVLTIMYGNMLRYYGDELTSQSYLKNIERPNFYDELYGLQVS